MNAPTIDIALRSVPFGESDYLKDTWLVLLHANRIPPHAGLLINGVYNSLTVKGQELDVALEILLKMIARKKIEAVFIKLVPHPVFSKDYQLSVFREIIKRSEPVTQFETTCLSPLKIFFREFYALSLDDKELLFEFITRLNDNRFLEYFSGCHFEPLENVLQLPFYNADELHEKIKTERLMINKA